jgi:hypothetical protein
MAYKQSPGRQAMPKTGRGLSPTLMSGSPMKQDATVSGKLERRKLPKEPQAPKAPPKSGVSKSGKNGPTDKLRSDKFSSAKLRPAKNSPMKQTVTAQGAASRARVLAAEGKRKKLKNDNIVIDPKTNVATAAPYPKKFVGGEAESSNKKVPTGKRSNAMVVETKTGKKVKEAKKGQGKFSNESLYREFKRDSTNTMNANNRAARHYNLQTGRAQANAEELASGQARTFYAKNQGQ